MNHQGKQVNHETRNDEAWTRTQKNYNAVVSRDRPLIGMSANSSVVFVRFLNEKLLIAQQNTKRLTTFVAVSTKQRLDSGLFPVIVE